MGLTFDQLRKANVKRCVEGFGRELDHWNLAEWSCALAGEAGEACNIAKKLLRKQSESEATAKQDDRVTVQDYARELADIVVYADLIAASIGVDLGETVRAKFNEVSERIDSDIKLQPTLVRVLVQEWERVKGGEGIAASLHQTRGDRDHYASYANSCFQPMGEPFLFAVPERLMARVQCTNGVWLQEEEYLGLRKEDAA